MGVTDERQKGVVICQRCREVYSVWIRPDGQFYPISSYNNCSCSDPPVRVIDDV